MTLRKAAIASGLVLACSACDIFDDIVDTHDDGQTSTIDDPNGFEDGPSDPGVDGMAGFAPVPARLGDVVTAERTPPPISGGTLAVSTDGAYVVAADSDRDQLYILHVADRMLRTVALEPGAEPGRVVIDGDLRAHVVLRGAGALARVDLAKATLLGRADVCTYPRGLVHQAATDTVVVACASGEVVTLTADAYAERARFSVERDLRDVVLDKSGQLLVTRYRSAEILALAADGSVARRLAPKRSVVPAFGDVLLPEGTTLEESGLPTTSPTLAWRALSTPEGDVVVLHQRSNDDEVEPLPGGYGGGGGTCNSITGPTLTHVGDDVGGAGPVLDGATLAVDVAVSSKDGVAVVAVPGAYLTNQRGTLQLYSAVVPPASTGQAGGDAGVEVDGDAGVGAGVEPGLGAGEGGCTTSLSESGYEQQVTSVAFGPDNTLYAFSREPAQILIFLGDPVAGFVNGLAAPELIELDEPSVRDTGHDLFHADVGGALACASCHGEVMDDGHVWTFAGFGPRRTQTMRGGLRGTEPFHWEGDMTTFQHLVDEVMTGRMGGFAVEPRYADALAQWIDKQPALTLPVEAADAVARGKSLFSSAGCTGCHTGAKLTNNATVDVGTGGAFQVPSLRGLAMRAPYMHDGCAATLRGRFSPACGGSAHGDTSKLSEAQISDLIKYLDSL